MNEVLITAKTLDDIQQAVLKLARRIDVPGYFLPTYGHAMGDARPHIEVDQRGFHFVIVERGQELDRKTTLDPNELAYWIFETATFSMAVDFELHHREQGKDCRRMFFLKQEELLGLLDASWRKRLEEYHQQILRKHPFDDQSSIRAQYCKQLRDTGTDPEKAWALACEKYPLSIK